MRRVNRTTTRRSPLVVAIAAAAALASACGFSHGPDFTIGFRRVALDLSYKDEALAKPSEPQHVVIPQPVVSNGLFVIQQPPLTTNHVTPVPQEPVKQNLCPTAGPDVHPDNPVTVFATTPPKAGTYFVHNDGKFTIGNPPLQTTFQAPKHGLFQIKNVVQTEDDTSQVNGPTQVITWDLVQDGLGGSTTTTYRTTFSPSPVVSTVLQAAQQAHAPSGELDLVRLQIESGKTKVDFQPNPPVTLMAFKNGQGTSWNSAGIDQRDGTSMVVQGSITKRTNVDLCGKVYDTFEVVSNEQVANLRTGLTSRTDPNDPNVYDVGTQYGGLFLRQHISTTVTFPTDTGTTTIVSNYTSTLDSLDPAS